MTYKILLVDDEPDVLHALVRVLRKQPYDLFSATSAHEAFEILDNETIDVAVVDQRMPGMTGIDILSYIKETKPHVKRLMLTGSDDIQTAIRAVNEGEVFRFLKKPCKGLAIAYAIYEAIEARQKEEAEAVEALAASEKADSNTSLAETIGTEID